MFPTELRSGCASIAIWHTTALEREFMTGIHGNNEGNFHACTYPNNVSHETVRRGVGPVEGICNGRLVVAQNFDWER